MIVARANVIQRTGEFRMEKGATMSHNRQKRDRGTTCMASRATKR